MTPHDFMSRKIIELHNFDKYQPFFHAPLVDRIEGDAEEIILSGDGRDTSASGNTTGSLSMNVSGGVWIDYLDVTTQHFGVSGSLATASTTLFQFDTSVYQSAFVMISYKTGAITTAERLEIACDGSDIEVNPFGAYTPSSTGKPTYSGSVSSSIATITINGSVGATYRATVQLL